MKPPHFKRIRTKRLVMIVVMIGLWLLADIGFGMTHVSFAMESKEGQADVVFKRVLVLNSYDEGYRWTSEQSNAITDRLKEEYDDILIFVEYMDAKYHPEKDNLAQLYELYRYKYSKIKIDLIFATDNDALEFALEHRGELFSDAPIVFSGITEDAANTMVKGHENIVGVLEVTDPAGTMKAAAKINPDISRVYIIYENSSTGRDSKKQIIEDHVQDQYELISLNMLPIDEILETISMLEQDSAVLLGAYTVDAKGFKIPADKFAKLISEASSVPVYDLWNFRMGDGVLGGSLLSGSTMGEYAADLGVRLLNREPIESMQIVNHKVVESIYDYEQLERFNISMSLLPEGSQIINKPFSFYETYKELVIGTSFAFIVLLIYIMLLIKNIGKRKKAEMKVHESNQELTALYGQMSAIDQQLKYQLSELSVAHEKLQLSEAKYRMVAEATNDIVWDWNMDSGIIRYSGGLKEILGYDDAEIYRKEDWLQIVVSEDAEYVKTAIEKFVQKDSNEPVCEYRVRHKDGRTIWISTKAKMLLDQSGKPSKIVGSHINITRLKEYQNRIWEMAYYDELTKLPNRAYLKEYVTKQINSNYANELAMIYIDIDDFKAINDNFGHSEGDKLLIEVGNMLNEITEEENIVFRQGGDEFVVVLNHADRNDSIRDYVARMKAKFEDPIKLTVGEFHITLSGGIVVHPSDGEDFNTLLKNADIAMYYVKNNGKNNLEFFNNDMEKGVKEKLLLENSLRASAKEMNFTLHYQPIVDIVSRKILKFEALIRWNSPEFGVIPPSVFIKLAEENGLIVPIGSWVIRQSCIFAAQLASNGYSDVSVSINISPIQLRQRDFVPLIKDALAQSGAEAERIELEITESLLIDSFDLSLKKLNEIRELGMQISLDDFGQGYSSLTYLRMLPISTLKIDKAFLNDYINIDRNDQIICAIIDLAHGMKIRVVAEGVETTEQLQFLRKNHCDLIQGYLISKPVPEREAFALLK